MIAQLNAPVNTPVAPIRASIALRSARPPALGPRPAGPWRIVAEGTTIRNRADAGSRLDRDVKRMASEAPKPLPGQLALPLGPATIPPRPSALPPVVADIPPDLATIPHWVVWRYEWRPGSAGRPGKWTKVPFKPDGSGLASSTAPEDWGTLARAARTYAAGRFDGLGFVVTAELGFVGVDLDHCLDADGSLAEWAGPIVACLSSYTERTPGRDGLRVWVRGSLPPGWRKRGGFGADGRGAVEVYDSARYFTVTGARWGGGPAAIEGRPEALAALHAELAPTVAEVVPTRAESRSDRAEAPDDATVLGKIRGSRNGEKFAKLWAGDASDHGNDHSAADLALCGTLAFWCGPDASRIDAIFRRSGLMRPKWDQAHGARTYGAMTVGKALEGRAEFYDWGRGRPSAEAPTIAIGTDEKRVNDEAVAALCHDHDIYQRGGMLVTIRRTESAVARGLRRAVGAPTIAPVAAPTLRESLADAARWERIGADGEVKPAHPPEWTVSAVAARGHWPGIRHLGAIVEAPTLRHDGSILDRPGYDHDSGLFLAPSVAVPTIGEAPTRDDARRAASEILATVGEFPFAGEEHKAAWLAALLTPLARFAIDGPTPFFMIDATTPGSGKTLLADLVATIATGRHASKVDYPDDDAEMRKSLLAIALEGDALVLWDNIASAFGGSALDGALTGGTIRGRVLGRSEMTPALPVLATMLGTGNNVSYKGDFLRRVVPIRLEPDVESPESRTGFAHPDLLAYVEAERGRLLASALTILLAHSVAGRPMGELGAFGSFEAWSRVVRGAVRWATGIDPIATRAGLAAHDPDAQLRVGLIAGLAELAEAEGKALTCAEILKIVGDASARYATLREALGGLGRHGELPSARALGMRLNRLRGRVVEGKRLESVPIRGGMQAWRVVPVGGHEKKDGWTGWTGWTNSLTPGEKSSKCTLDAGGSLPPVAGIFPGGAGISPTSPTSPTTPDPWATISPPESTQSPRTSLTTQTPQTTKTSPAWESLRGSAPADPGRTMDPDEFVRGLGLDPAKGVPIDPKGGRP